MSEQVIMRYRQLIIVAAGGFIAGAALIGWLTAAGAQPSYQQNSVPYCPTGVFDAQGNPVVQPCGGVNVPPMVIQEIQHPTQPYQTQTCPPNPISKKVPPLC